MNVFLQKNKSWLDKYITFSVGISNVLTNTTRENIPSTSVECLQDTEETLKESRVGRPTKEWHDLSERSRKRKAQEMLSHHTEPTGLLYAASQGAYQKKRILSMYLNLL